VLTEQVFEQHNIDPIAILAEVHRLLGPCEVLLGGSLADDLGTMGSDIDLYCFPPRSDPQVRRPMVTSCFGTTLELHVVDWEALADEDLSTLIIPSEPPSPQHWPLLSPQRFRQLHALHRDRALQAGPITDRARRRSGADLLHVYVGLRAAITVGALAEDLVVLDGAENDYARLYCARLAVESAMDAALATLDLINPNPKWRLLLASRARFLDSLFPDPEKLLPALFPRVEQPDRELAVCLAAASECLRLVEYDGVLRRFPAVRSCAALVRSVAAALGTGVAS
jgi:hypothetical protein